MTTKKLDLYTDGGSRGNPGPAAIGGVLKEGQEVRGEFSHYLGRATNNTAEYEALIAGLKLVEGRASEITCHLDSELVVRQLTGRYRVKQPHLQALFRQVKQLESKFSLVTYRYIPRDQNRQADQLVNQALDKMA